MDLENISTSFEDILQEVQTMRLCDDENVLRCYCSFVHLDQLWLVTQLMDKGSCLRVMNVSKAMGYGEGMNEEWLAYILKEALQVSKSMSSMHNKSTASYSSEVVKCYLLAVTAIMIFTGYGSLLLFTLADTESVS